MSKRTMESILILIHYVSVYEVSASHEVFNILETFFCDDFEKGWPHENHHGAPEMDCLYMGVS